MLEISERLTEHARQTIERLDLTGAFRADVPHAELPFGNDPPVRCDSCGRAGAEGWAGFWCGSADPWREKCSGTFRSREPAQPEPCSCEEALALRAQLAQATAGAVALHVVKAEGFWSIERWRDGALVESYVGVPTVAEALERIGDWLRNS